MDKFSIFLQELKCLHELPKYDIAEYMETFACEGCGLGKECKKYNERFRPCWDCENCKTGNRNKCENLGPCEDCYWCGCPKCMYDNDQYDGCITYPPFEYDERLNAKYVILIKELKTAVLPFDIWMTVIPKKFRN